MNKQNEKLHNRCAKAFIDATENIPKENITDKEVGFFKMGYKAAEKETEELVKENKKSVEMQAYWEMVCMGKNKEIEEKDKKLKEAVELLKEGGLYGDLDTYDTTILFLQKLGEE